MGENREGAEESPRKAPRLDLQDAAAAAADSGRGEAVSAPEVSNLREEGTEGTSDNNQCKHIPPDSAYMKMLRPSLYSERAGRCELCEHPFPGSSILVCLVCGRYFCSGVGSVEYPYGHSREHAQEEEHWVAALSEGPESAFCFMCDCVMDGPRDTIRELLAATEADSGSGNQALPEPEGSDEPCNHVPTDSAHTEMLRYALISEHAGKCEHCKTFKGGSILVCTECGLHFCTGLGSVDCPSGHARLHAKQKQHWVAALFDEPEFGYCFKCEFEVCVTVPPDDAEIMDKVDAELSNEAPYALGSAYVHGYAVRGMPNLGNTCYLNALVQCLLALDKLRARMLGPDAPDSLVATALKELFVETSTAGGMLDPAKFLMCVGSYDQTFKGTDMQDSLELFLSLCKNLNEAEEEKGKSGAATVMNSIFGFEMSETMTCTCSLTHSVCPSLHYELSMSLPSTVHPAKSAASSQTSASLKSQPVIDIQLCPANEQGKSGKIETVAECSDSHPHGSELKDMVVEETPEPLEVDSTEVQHICQRKDVVQGPLQAHEDKVSCPNLSQGIFEVLVKSVGLLPQNMFDVKFEDMNEITAESIASIEECLSLFCEHVTDWRCDNCKVYEELNTDQSKNGEQKVTSTNEDTTVGGDWTEQSDGTTCQNEQSSGLNSLSVECKSSSSRQLQGSVAQGQILRTVDKFAEETNLGMSFGEKDSAACNTPKEPECHAGNLEAISSCLPAEKQTDLLRTQHNQNVSIEIKMYQDSRKQIGLDHRACQLKNDRNEQQRDRGRNRDAIQKTRFNNLPPVLTLHLKRFNNFQEKISGHVRYKEYLDVGPFMDPSSAGKDNSIYRLVGVVEHRGTKSLEKGHVIAYVRTRKLGNPQQQGSCSYSWFCADDRMISEVSLDDVLKREAYILFYESMEGMELTTIQNSSHKTSIGD